MASRAIAISVLVVVEINVIRRTLPGGGKTSKGSKKGEKLAKKQHGSNLKLFRERSPSVLKFDAGDLASRKRPRPCDYDESPDTKSLSNGSEKSLRRRPAHKRRRCSSARSCKHDTPAEPLFSDVSKSLHHTCNQDET